MDFSLFGGSAGPEGSLLPLPILIVMLAGMCVWWGRGKSALGLAVRQPSGKLFQIMTQHRSALAIGEVGDWDPGCNHTKSLIESSQLA